MPTSWKVLRKYNPSKKKSEIFSAFPEEKTICDFLGTKDGIGIAIETKSSNNKTSFPFSNIKDHQFIFFKNWLDNGGKGYYIIWFRELNRAFIVESNKIQQAKDTLDRKSLTIQWLEENSHELDEDMNFIDYI